MFALQNHMVFVILDIESLLGGFKMTVKEKKKTVAFTFTESEVALIDEIVDIENDRRKTIAREYNLPFKKYNRSTFVLAMIEEKKRKYAEQGEI